MLYRNDCSISFDFDAAYVQITRLASHMHSIVGWGQSSAPNITFGNLHTFWYNCIVQLPWWHLLPSQCARLRGSSLTRLKRWGCRSSSPSPPPMILILKCLLVDRNRHRPWYISQVHGLTNSTSYSSLVGVRVSGCCWAVNFILGF